jgi:ABC-type nickel/cobalt efflux system permease component RcnA
VAFVCACGQDEASPAAEAGSGLLLAKPWMLWTDMLMLFSIEDDHDHEHEHDHEEHAEEEHDHEEHDHEAAPSSSTETSMADLHLNAYTG